MKIQDVNKAHDLVLETVNAVKSIRIVVQGTFEGFFTVLVSSPNSPYYRELHFDRSPINWSEDMPWDHQDAIISYGSVDMKSGDITISAAFLTK